MLFVAINGLINDESGPEWNNILIKYFFYFFISLAEQQKQNGMNLEMIGIEQTTVCTTCLCAIAKQFTATKNLATLIP